MTSFNELSSSIKEKRLAEIQVLKTHIINYVKTKDVYADYRKCGYSKKFLEEHRQEILLHKAAKNAFDELGVEKLLKVKELNAEEISKACSPAVFYIEVYDKNGNYVIVDGGINHLVYYGQTMAMRIPYYEVYPKREKKFWEEVDRLFPKDKTLTAENAIRVAYCML